MDDRKAGKQPEGSASSAPAASQPEERLAEQSQEQPSEQPPKQPADAEAQQTQAAAGQPTRGRPRLLLMGQRRSGKSSISSVVFHKLPPNETLFLESTARIQQDQMASFMEYQVWDFPGQIDVFEDPSYDMDAIFGEIGALIWVIDSQDDYMDAVARLNTTILFLQRSYPHINIEVFIHKVDGHSDDYKLDIQRDITIRIQDELSDHGFENAPVTFHLTSIYNHSIFEAFSKVIQKLIPRLGILEAMLNDLCRNCHFEKAYIFDALSKIYIATDSEPSDMAAYELCSDYIDVIIDINDVYGSWSRSAKSVARLEGPPWSQKLEDQIGSQMTESCMLMRDSLRPLILREVTPCLCLVAIMKEGTYDKMPLVNLNIDAIIKGIHEFFEITKQKS